MASKNVEKAYAEGTIKEKKYVYIVSCINIDP